MTPFSGKAKIVRFSAYSRPQRLAMCEPLAWRFVSNSKSDGVSNSVGTDSADRTAASRFVSRKDANGGRVTPKVAVVLVTDPAALVTTTE